MTKDTIMQHVRSTLPFPSRHVVGVFDSLQQGEQVVQALVDAGYHVKDIALIPGQDFPSAFQEHVRKEGRLRHMLHQLQVTTDEESLNELLEASTREGADFISIYVPQREHIDEVSAILFKHGARLVKYIGLWSIEDLFSSGKEENVAAKVTTAMSDEPQSDDQEAGQARLSSTSTWTQDWEGEQVLSSTAAEVAGLFVMAVRSARGDAEKQRQLRALLERSRIELSEFIHGSGQDYQQTIAEQDEDDEPEGQEMNIEQAHQTRTAQYMGKPGVKAPSYGQAPGSAG